MFYTIALQWPPQHSTVIGLGIFAGTVCYLVTGDPVWAGVAASAVKILVPDNSAAASQVSQAIETLAQASGRPPARALWQPSLVSDDQETNAGSLCRDPPGK